MLFEFRDDTEKCGRGKNFVLLYHSSCVPATTHECDPPTVRYGNFCLLHFRPGPVRSYLANLLLIIYTELFCELSHINIILSPIYCIRVGGVKVSIVAFQAIDPGSIPG